jgi:cytochrome c oxidase subunit 2
MFVAHQVTKTKVSLGPYFWLVTAFILVASAIMSYFVYASGWPIGLPEIAEPAPEIDALFKFLGAMGGTIFNIVTGYIIYFAIVFRRKKSDPPDAIGVQIHDNPVLEFWWTVIPTILVVILAIFSTVIWSSLQNTAGDVLTMEAIGHQYYFSFRYPKLANPVNNEMHVPVNVPVTLHVTSAEPGEPPVNHGFWVPEVRLKADMVPGLINTLRFTPTQIGGPYRIICTEFCGALHGTMRATFYIDSQKDFDKWFAKQGGSGGSPGAGGAAGGGAGIALANGNADQGATLFAAKCSACHSVNAFSDKKVGPGLGKIFSDPGHPKLVNGTAPTPADAAAIMKNGYTGDIGQMPDASTNQITDGDIANLVAYLASLSKK